jgi:hypothetical protein
VFLSNVRGRLGIRTLGVPVPGAATAVPANRRRATGAAGRRRPDNERGLGGIAAEL